MSLTACRQSRPLDNFTHQSPQTMMAHVAKQVQACWFKSKNPAFKPYKMAAELNSFSGKPRILLVPRHRPSGLPKLVAQAERKAGKTEFTAFGPLLKSSNGSRLYASLYAWANGQSTC